MEQEREQITAAGIAGGLAGIYEDFTEAVRALGGKGKKRSGKMAESMGRWVAGSRAGSVREQLCEKFLADVQGQLELLMLALEGLSEEECAQACGIAVNILTAPCPSKSNATTDLMKRAMIGQAEPLLPYLSKEQLAIILERLKGAYTKWQMLPVEKEVAKELERLLAGREGE